MATGYSSAAPARAARPQKKNTSRIKPITVLRTAKGKSEKKRKDCAAAKRKTVHAGMPSHTTGAAGGQAKGRRAGNADGRPACKKTASGGRLRRPPDIIRITNRRGRDMLTRRRARTRILVNRLYKTRWQPRYRRGTCHCAGLHGCSRTRCKCSNPRRPSCPGRPGPSGTAWRGLLPRR